jgi:hypothetical protein
MKKNRKLHYHTNKRSKYFITEKSHNTNLIEDVVLHISTQNEITRFQHIHRPFSRLDKPSFIL